MARSAIMERLCCRCPLSDAEMGGRFTLPCWLRPRQRCRDPGAGGDLIGLRMGSLSCEGAARKPGHTVLAALLAAPKAVVFVTRCQGDLIGSRMGSLSCEGAACRRGRAFLTALLAAPKAVVVAPRGAGGDPIGGEWVALRVSA